MCVSTGGHPRSQKQVKDCQASSALRKRGQSSLVAIQCRLKLPSFQEVVALLRGGLSGLVSSQEPDNFRVEKLMDRMF